MKVEKYRTPICKTITRRITRPFTVNVFNDYIFGARWFNCKPLMYPTVIYRIKVIPKAIDKAIPTV